MTIKRKDFQKAAALIHEFQLKISEDAECAELRDALNLALLHMQKYYRTLRSRLQTQDKNNGSILSASLRGLSPMTPFKDAPDRFQWKWMNLDNPKLTGTLPADIHKDVTTLPAIILAAKEGNVDHIMHLIDKDEGAVLELDGIGRTSLMYAVNFHNLDSLQVLLEQGAEVDAIAHDGSTAVHRACHNGDYECLQILIEYQANLEIQDVQGRAPIHWACTTPNRECLRLLLREGVSVGIRDKDGMSPSMWACRMDNIEHFELLTAADDQEVLEEDGYERDNNGRTWMHWSVRRVGQLECLKTLLSEESACLREDEGKTVMHTAAERGSVAASKQILEIGGMTCLEHRDAANRTPLILATMNGHGEMVNYLLTEGADLASVDNNGATAWDYARGRQLHYCMLIIASYIRQRAIDDGQDPNVMLNGQGTMNSAFNGTFPSMMGDTMEEENLGLTHLQINGETEEDVIFYGNRPVAPPHPPPGPPTPRTPRGMTPRSITPSTPRGRQGAQTPRTPNTPRGYGLKRSPSVSMDAEDQDTGEINKRDISAGSKRKKVNMEGGQDREGHMSVMSVDSGDHQPHSQGSHHSTPNVSAAEPELASDSQYLEQCGPHGNNAQGDVDSVSIGEMDVSDMGSDGRDENNPLSPAAPIQPPQPHPRYNQLNPPPSPRGGQQHYYPSYSPQPPKTPPYNAHSPGEVKVAANLPDAQELEELLQDLDKSDLDITPQNLDFDQTNAPLDNDSNPEKEKPPPAPLSPRHSQDDFEVSNDEEEDHPMNDGYQQAPYHNDATPMGEPRNGPLGGMPDAKEDDVSPFEDSPREPKTATQLDNSPQPVFSPLGPPRFPASSSTPQRSPTGAFGLPASMHHNQDGRVIPPAHLLPLDLPPHSPTKLLKKKKRKRRDRSLSNEKQDLPPARGYTAPVSASSGYQGSAGRDRTPHQGESVEPHGPGSAGQREKSPNRSGGLPPTPKPRDRSPASNTSLYRGQRGNKRTPRGEEDRNTLDSRKFKGKGSLGHTGSASSGKSGGSMNSGGSFPAHGSSHHTTPPLPQAQARSRLTRAGTEEDLTVTDDDDDGDQYDDDDDDDDDNDDDDRAEEDCDEEEEDHFEEIEDMRRHSAGSGSSQRGVAHPQRGYSSGRGRRYDNGPSQNSTFSRSNSSRGGRESQGSGGLRRRPPDQQTPAPRARPRPGKSTVPPLNNKYHNRLPPSY